MTDPNTLSFSILLPVHHVARQYSHGDYFFGQSLVRALERRGHKARVIAGERWDETGPDDIALLIRGRAPMTRRLGRMTMAWCISFFPKPAQEDYANTDHFFAASQPLANRMARIAGKDRVSLMYQAFDPELMYPDGLPPNNDMVFVGTPRDENRRPVVSYAAQSGLPFRLWGNGWEETPFEQCQVGGNVPNEGLGDIYRSGALVLNDHLVIMQRNHIGSNRIYDGLACGRAVLNDVNEGLPPELKPFVYGYSDADSLKEQARLALSETEDRRAERLAFATLLRDMHSFDQRADQIVQKVNEFGG